MSQLPFYKLRVVANILTLHRYLVQSINANGSAKIGHVGTNYTSPHKWSYLSTGIEYLYPVVN